MSEEHIHDEHQHDDHHDDHHGDVNEAANRGLRNLAIFAAGVFVFLYFIPFQILGSAGFFPAVPVLTVFGEPIQHGVWVWPVLGGDIINTMLALIVVDIIILAIAYYTYNAHQTGEIPTTALGNAFEALFEYLYNQTKQIAGTSMAKDVFPIVSTMFLIVLLANLTKIIPGYESVGALHCAEDEEIVTMSGYPIHGADTIFEDYEDGGAEAVGQVDIPTFLGIPYAFLLNDSFPNAGTTADHASYEACKYRYFHDDKLAEAYYGSDYQEGRELSLVPEDSHGEGGDDEHSSPVSPVEELLISYEAAGDDEEARDAIVENNTVDNLVVAPFFRGASTDLNFTMAMAVFAVFWVQFFGVRELGLPYFYKFVNLPALGSGDPINFVVGILEILSEIAKVISFTFRLFGAMFAGGILLVVLTFLASMIVPMAVVGLELFVGLIQAYVFFILPLALIKLATLAHH